VKSIKFWILIRWLIFSVSAILMLSCSKAKKDDYSFNANNPDLNNHQIYSQYEFEKNANVINIGIQPLYLPTGIIMEVIKRDNILNRALLKSGKKIEYYPFMKGADLNFFIKNKMLCAGVGGDMPALSLSASIEVEIPIILQKGNVSLVSSKPMLTNDIKGKRIAYPYGSISHYYIYQLLNSAGLKENQVKLIPMEIDLMGKSLYNNKIDLFSAWEPMVTESIKQYPDFFVTFKNISTGYMYFDKSQLEEEEVIHHIISAVIRAVNWLKISRNNLLLACARSAISSIFNIGFDSINFSISTIFHFISGKEY